MRCIFPLLPVACWRAVIRTRASFNVSCGLQSTLVSYGQHNCKMRHLPMWVLPSWDSLILFFFYQSLIFPGVFHICPDHTDIYVKNTKPYYYFFLNFLGICAASLNIPWESIIGNKLWLLITTTNVVERSGKFCRGYFLQWNTAYWILETEGY